MTLAYLDSSAFLKLINVEPESDAMRDFLGAWPGQASSSLLRTESMRAARLSGHSADKVREAWARLRLVGIDDAILDDAGAIDPPRLRSLDAVHLAAARALGDDLGVFVTYDAGLAEAANALGIPTAAPGSKNS